MDKVKIAVGESRFTKKWRNEEMPIADFVARLKDTRRTTETISEFRKLPKTEADNIKDIGGFVGGHLKNGSRTRWSITRSTTSSIPPINTRPSIQDFEL